MVHEMNRNWIPALAALLGGCGGMAGSAGPEVGGSSGVYDVWVASEAADQVARIRFSSEGGSVIQTRTVGSMPLEIDGPHGLALSPDARLLFVTIGHGVPFGSLWKLDAETLEVFGRTPLGHFPATVSITPDGDFAFVSNFNLHGDPVPSSISKVHLAAMVEVARTETCTMPHGSRVNAAGTRHYSVCMMDEVLVELDVATGAVHRAYSVARGHEGPVPHPIHGAGSGGHASPEDLCSPTWAEPGVDGSRVFVACNRSQEVLEIDVERWEVVRRFRTGDSPYNIGITPDGRKLLVTLRSRTDPALEVFDLRSGQLAGRVSASTTLVHGVAVSSDSRFAFISVEGVGAEPGKVDMIDLDRLRRVASVAVGQQATGIAVRPGNGTGP